MCLHSYFGWFVVHQPVSLHWASCLLPLTSCIVRANTNVLYVLATRMYKGIFFTLTITDIVPLLPRYENEATTTAGGRRSTHLLAC